MFIYKEADIRRADQQAEQSGLSVQALMEQAGRSLYEAMVPHLTRQQRIGILCGSGNNGGDGIALARWLRQNGYEAEVLLLGEPKTEAAASHLRYYEACGFSAAAWNREARYEVIVDAMLGIGARLPLRGRVLEAVQWANGQKALRFAVDVPSGVAADTGEATEAFQAHRTFCLHGYKPSAFLLPSSVYYGKAHALDIGLPQQGAWRMWGEADVKRTLPARPFAVHKGIFGTGLLLGGSDDMPGSVLLAAMGAMRGGIGKLVIGTTRFAAGIAAGRLPEATYWLDGLDKAAQGSLPDGIRAAAIGPGLDDPEQVERALEHLLVRNMPLVLDAGALAKRGYPRRNAPVVLTPHPGEFSRMTGLSVKELQQNRMAAASRYAVEQGVMLVLKGAYTVIALPDGTGYINPTGNAALAKGGTGDTLTGLLLAFLCTHEDAAAAVANAVYVHGACADAWTSAYAAEAMLASDLSGQLPLVLRELSLSNQE
ncbi:NAD(P)H-hydrate dehydratase [Ectobacillus ponti]|uniref:Bifunctional NAD(P)H-hydrate repair enzyme n=1 Tax=Ectobacillus ponti TaxID=2961894 RepID=A0AA41X4K4_9BACI|nr:NAD(P)H-hydrate dehydratase [Ectobacillus ponti]MCP8968627.1 NAD(P)H-hydrate dehydratase [Ectobacillus ponti]